MPLVENMNVKALSQMSVACLWLWEVTHLQMKIPHSSRTTQSDEADLSQGQIC